ncbi:unnamed protein product [Schistocephalus solidus]|uniref:ACT domain-containing protein n=1 Tax=Schistocephalus solidus TaxID=70667 RepID=A0A183S8Y5_SCHSO|nr:unnamed protein product [Schistocephalus solidus]
MPISTASTELCKASQKKNVIVVAELNAPGIDWQTWTALSLPDNFNPKWLHWAMDRLSSKNVNFRAQTRKGQQSNCLDLIFIQVEVDEEKENFLEL